MSGFVLNCSRSSDDARILASRLFSTRHPALGYVVARAMSEWELSVESSTSAAALFGLAVNRVHQASRFTRCDYQCLWWTRLGRQWPGTDYFAHKSLAWRERLSLRHRLARSPQYTISRTPEHIRVL